MIVTYFAKLLHCVTEQPSRSRPERALVVLLLAWCATLPGLIASEVLDVAGVKGGLCVDLGCGSGALAVEIVSANPRFVVHGLDADVAAIATARQSLHAANRYGQVMVEEWSQNTLPYADNTVSLLVVGKPCAVAVEECMRVLAPDGVLCVRDNGQWIKQAVKGRPSAMDSWPQWRHGSDHNPVSNDTLVEVPKRIQWLSYMSPLGKTAVVHRNRYFNMINHVLYARDAFNGVPLWQYGTKLNVRPVATDKGVFVVNNGRLLCLDRDTGVELTTSYIQAGVPAMVMHVPDATGTTNGTLLTTDATSIRALDVDSGVMRWSVVASSPRAVSSKDGRVFLISGDPVYGTSSLSTVMALSLETGATLWSQNKYAWATSCYRSCVGPGLISFETGRFAIDKPFEGDTAAVDGIHLLSTITGEAKLDYNHTTAMRHENNPHTFFIRDKIYLHLKEAVNYGPSRFARFSLTDILAGAPNVMPDVQDSPYTRGMDLFCHPPVATTRFFMYGELGYTNWDTYEHVSNPITRGACGRDSEGVIPANSFTYVFPNGCTCFSMLNGVAALAPAYERTLNASQVLVPGPAYQQTIPLNQQDDEWPGYRRDAYRTGSTAREVPLNPQTIWTATIAGPNYQTKPATIPVYDEWKNNAFTPGPLTPPVIAQGMVFVAQPHTHRIIALDEQTGALRWTFTANGRIDSAPTIYQGLCLFGSRSGWAFCVRASDGAEVWRLRVAPNDLRIVHCGQVESTSPAPGSILVDQGVAYISAGVHALTDNQVQVFAVVPATGEVIWNKTVSNMGYAENQMGYHHRQGVEQDYMDMVVKDGANQVSVSRWVFDQNTGDNVWKWQNAYYRVGAEGAYVPRGSWSYGYPVGRTRADRPLVVASGNALFGANRLYSDVTQNRLFRRDYVANEAFDVQWGESLADSDTRTGRYHPVNRSAEKTTWTAAYPGWIDALLLAGDHLFVSVENATPVGTSTTKIYSATTGALLSTMSSNPWVPVWDGFAACKGRLYVSPMDGRVLCLGKYGPTVTMAAQANANPVSTTSTALSVRATDDGGEAALRYTWSVDTAPAPVVFGVTNGTNAGKDALATFSKAGMYQLRVTVSDRDQLQAISQVLVRVDQVATALVVAPSASVVRLERTRQFTASVHDQFGHALLAQPTVEWTVSGGGTVSPIGLFTAGNQAANVQVTAHAGLTGTAELTVTDVPNQAPTVATPATATADPVTGTTVGLAALGADDDGEAELSYHWSASGPAAVSFSNTDGYEAKNTVATFAKVGTYQCTVTITDSDGLSTTSTVTVRVDPTITAMTVDPKQAVVKPGTSQQFTVHVTDQFGAEYAEHPAVSWMVSGGGSCSTSGLFIAGNVQGTYTITATHAAVRDSATITIPEPTPLMPVTVVPGSTMAYGLRYLSDEYRLNNPLVQIRRSSDGAMASWGDDGSTWLSLDSRSTDGLDGDPTLGEWIGGDDGFVVTWYDQSGARNDAVQPVAANQPQVIKAGQLYLAANNRPYLVFNGTSHCMQVPKVIEANWTLTLTAITTQTKNSSVWTNDPGFLGGDVSSSYEDFGFGMDAGKPIMGIGASSARVFSTTNIATGKAATVSWDRLSSTGAVNVRVNGGATVSGVLATGAKTKATTLSLGSSAAKGGGSYFAGMMTEIIAYPSVLSDVQRQIIEQSQGSLYGSILPSPPTIASAAIANPAVVSTGTTTDLSVLGADNFGESALTYTWMVVGTPPAPVVFSVNGNNAAKTTRAMFTKAGQYAVVATISDAGGLSVTSNEVIVTVAQPVSSVAIQPAIVSVAVGSAYQFSAVAIDRFGDAVIPMPPVVWSTTGDNTVSAAGLFTAGTTPGSAVVTAACQGVFSSVPVTITAAPMENAAPVLISPAAVVTQTGTSANLSVTAADDGGEAALLYAWSCNRAGVTFDVNGTNAAKTVVAQFTQLGTYELTVSISDHQGLQVTSGVAVVIAPVASAIAVAPATATIEARGTKTFAATVSDQFAGVMEPSSPVVWSVTGGGSIADTGLFTAGGEAGTATVTATSGSLVGSSTVTVTPPPSVYPLDLVTNAVAAYGLRQLRQAYTGPVVKIRRATDNQEATWNVDATGWLTANSPSSDTAVGTATLGTWIGTANGYVSVWYDQSGAGVHATQVTAANQPLLVANGILQQKGGHAAVVFDGTNSWMSVTRMISTDWTMIGTLTTSSVKSSSVWSNDPCILGGMVSSSTEVFGMGLDLGKPMIGVGAGANRVVAGTSVATGLPATMTWQRTSATGAVAIRINGQAAITGGTALTGAKTKATVLSLGTSYANGTGTRFAGAMSEILVYGSVLSSASCLTLEHAACVEFGSPAPVPAGVGWQRRRDATASDVLGDSRVIPFAVPTLITVQP